jgi:hypothetical protein
MINQLQLSKQIFCYSFLIVFICSISASDAQILEFHKKDTIDENKMLPRYRDLQIKFQYGLHAPTGVDELRKTIEEHPFRALELRFGWKGYGRKRWHQFYNFPTYGLGFYQATFTPQKNILGNPSALYTFFHAPFKRWKNSSFDYDIGVGISYNFKN